MVLRAGQRSGQAQHRGKIYGDTMLSPFGIKLEGFSPGRLGSLVWQTRSLIFLGRETAIVKVRSGIIGAINSE